MSAAVPVESALSAAAATLADRVATPRLEAEVLLAHVLASGRTTLYAHPDAPLETGARARFEALVARRVAGEPVAYLTGRREFWSLTLEVTPETLIPRPETECLVAACLDLVPRGGRARIADLGTGSGAVAVALARERPGCRLVATDCERGALAVARRNVRRHGTGNVSLLAGSWCAPLAADSFDAVVSNPPYVNTGDPHLDRGDVRFEPRQALVGGDDGLDALVRIAAGARSRLVPGGWLVLEHGHDQGPAVRGLMGSAGLRDVATVRDDAGHERITRGRRPG